MEVLSTYRGWESTADIIFSHYPRNRLAKNIYVQLLSMAIPLHPLQYFWSYRNCVSRASGNSVLQFSHRDPNNDIAVVKLLKLDLEMRPDKDKSRETHQTLTTDKLSVVKTCCVFLSALLRTNDVAARFGFTHMVHSYIRKTTQKL